MRAVAEASGHFGDNNYASWRSRMSHANACVVRGVDDLTELADGPGQESTGLFPGGKSQGVPLGRRSG